jgi:hypothetical protein
MLLSTAGRGAPEFDLAEAALAVTGDPLPYVSRAALKLLHGLDAFAIDPAGAIALDIGASTGGFTQVLLERDAAHVTAIDVGHGQLHESLAADPRVTSIEGLNARDLTVDHLGGRFPDIIVSDVSFISLKLALPPALGLAALTALLLVAAAILVEHAEIMIGELQEIFRLDAVALHLRIPREALILFQQLGRVSALAVILAVARTRHVRTASAAATAPAAALTIADQTKILTNGWSL